MRKPDIKSALTMFYKKKNFNPITMLCILPLVLKLKGEIMHFASGLISSVKHILYQTFLMLILHLHNISSAQFVTFP